MPRKSGWVNQKKIMEYLRSRGQIPPTVCEISRDTGIPYRTAQYHLDVLQERGLITRQPGKARTLAVVGELPEPQWQQGCQVQGCQRYHRAKGYCGLHYQQLYKGRHRALLRPDPDPPGFLRPEERQAIVEEYRAGVLPVRAIAAKYGVSRQYPSYLAKRAGVPLRGAFGRGLHRQS